MKTKLIGICFVAVLALLLSGVGAQSQDDIEFLSSDAFLKDRRPPAVFKHDAHNELAEIEDCNVCHHVYENGQFMEDDDSVGTPCADCHTLKAQGSQPGLMTAYHKQCKGCHETKGKGPMACGQCHVKN